MLIDALKIGGAETHVEVLSEQLRDMGHEILVASAGGQIHNRLSQNGIRCFFLPTITEDGTTKITNTSQSTRLSSQKATRNATPFLRAPSFFRFFEAQLVITKIISQEKPNIVHAHTRRSAFLAHNICKKHKIPLIVTAHAKFSMNFPKNLFSKWGDGTICVSEDIKNHLLEHKIAPKQLCIIANGVKLPQNTFEKEQENQRGWKNEKNSFCEST